VASFSLARSHARQTDHLSFVVLYNKKEAAEHYQDVAPAFL
jgi:hypothetical protein